MHRNHRIGEADMESKVLELVVFKLAGGVSREQFLGTVDAVSSWISRQPGFISRELSYDAEGDRWIEVVWWRTMGEAQAAAELAMASESCAPMFGLIDMETTLMLHGELAIPPVAADSTAARARGMI
jgi:hypothetical protein